jgi:2-hydroxychromene-2-carboxylate isomerase
MGELIDLAGRRAARRAIDAGSPRTGAAAPVAFFFDLACPFSYLAAERVERLLGQVAWIPAASVALEQGQPWEERGACAAACAAAERRAAALRVPLIWPEGFPLEAPMALRAAAYAAEAGEGATFALAASRLAFCGGFDLEDPEILAEAAAVAGLPLDVCLAAAADEARDGQLHATARMILARGVKQLPAISIGRRWFAGERGVMEAAAWLRSPAAAGRSLAPVG